MAPSKNQIEAENDREAVKSTITFLEDQWRDQFVAPLTVATADHNLQLTMRAQEELMNAHTRIIHSKPSDIDDQIKTYCDLMKRIMILLGQFQGEKDKLKVSTNSTTTAPAVKLPVLNLPTFDGSLMDWVQFRDMFMSTVDKHASLSDSQKLAHLKTVLVGEPALLIKTLLLTDANYRIAWNTLQTRYQNEKELTFAIYKKFLALPTVQPQSAKSLRSLMDASSQCIQSLDAQNVKVEDGLASFMVYILLTKLDQSSRELFEQSLPNSTVPALKSLQDFMEHRARSLIAGEGIKPSCPSVQTQRETRRVSLTHHTTQAVRQCPLSCTDTHPLYRCNRFTSKPASERHEIVKRNHLCFNCLQSGHSINVCTSSSRCRTCNGKHHSLICQHQNSNSQPPRPAQQPPAVANHSLPEGPTQAILATAVVRIVDPNGTEHLCRAMLDGGSTTSFITTSCANRLKLPLQKSQVQVVGLSSTSVGNSKGSTTITIRPHFETSSSFVVSVLVLPRITGKLPYYPCNDTSVGHLMELRLADPQFNVSSPVDLLLGSDIFWNLLLDGKISGPPGTPVGINSHLGWLVAGQTKYRSQTSQIHSYHTSESGLPSEADAMTSSSNSIVPVQTLQVECNLDLQLQRFWELETLPMASTLTPEEIEAETHFLSTHSRDSSGRYTVVLPRKPNVTLGESRTTALRSLKSIESRLSRNPEYRDEYRKFMAEYISLGHMELVPAEEIWNPKNPVYYIPHHFVLKKDSTTTKFRVVFNASAKTTNGVSLNDSLIVGPVIQDNLVDDILRFRCSAIGFTADIAKMYRQIRVSEEDADLQRVFWRDDPSLPIKEYRLLTVAYGTAPAPFLATRTLQHLAETEAEKFPQASKVILRDFFMDDLLSGVDNITEAEVLCPQLLEVLKKGKFELRKWASNSQELLRLIPEELRESKGLPISPTTTSLDEDPSFMEGAYTSKAEPTHEVNDFLVKCLGIRWNTSKDNFESRISSLITEPQHLRKDTKRSILSDTAKLYDPLGLIAPVVITAKILMQDLWKLDCSWDSAVPEYLQLRWDKFKLDLKELNNLSIPRCTLQPKFLQAELAGFSDASEKAYSAVVYLCAYYTNSPPLISVVSSKTRVSPAKQISLPRLELCGALLLSQLVAHVKCVLRRHVTRVRAWTDSTVVLGWINTPSCRLKTFVGNRVTEIQANIHPTNWYHIPGIDNPADCASRGISAQELINHPLWWHGPSFLQQPPREDSHTAIESSDEDKKIVRSEMRPQPILCAATVAQPQFLDELIQRFSSFGKLVRVLAWILRFITIKCRPNLSPPNVSLTSEELNNARVYLVRFVQSSFFAHELSSIQKGKGLPSKSPLLPLSPFMDNDGLLRVGGRLKHSTIPYDGKHPFLLPRHSHLTDLIIQSKHEELFHAGPTLLQSVLQQTYWIIRAKDAIRYHTNKCIVCQRQRASTLQTKMGDLPASRVTPGRAFLNSGVDYAGPFIIKSDAPRSKYQSKAYLCIFVCMATRAIHLELVSSLSTEAFLAALKRFVSRRNKPSTIFSDCGTNFVGAARELKDLLGLVNAPTHNNKISDHLSSQGISWRFNPPSAPHFGGLWEAGVKSVKFHLKRVLGSAILNYEEFSTLLIQIEGCLNSRPLTPMSSSPDDLSALTPGHFLTGDSLHAVPEPDLMDLKTGRLNRWQLIQQMNQQFWRRWSCEYVSRLQQRPKWLNQRSSIQKDDLVIIKDERYPPQKWKLGRITELHPGQDNIVRVVTVKTSDGLMKRPIVKLCLLPIENSASSTSSDTI